MSGLQDGIRALLERGHRWRPLTGASICVVDCDGELLSVSSGHRDAASRVPVDRHTRFEIGSISKSFTCLTLGQLADDRLLDLSAPVAEYLPWLGTDPRFAPITLVHLMTHTAGLIAGGDGVPDAAAAGRALLESEVGCPPGEFFHYSNVGYALLGLVIERVTGRPLADVVAERLLGPLGMRESTAVIAHADHQRLATGYEALHDDRPWLPGDPLIPAPWFEFAGADGNVAATAGDLGRYARMLLGGGSLDGRRVVDQQRFAQLTEPTASGYACGWFVEQGDGRRRLTHGGGMVGFSSFLTVDLDAGLGVAVLTNAPPDCGVAETLARGALAAAESEDLTEALTELNAAAIPEAERHAGVYVGDGLRIEVEPTGDGGLRLVSGAVAGRLYDLGDGRLGCEHPEWRRFPHAVTGRGPARRWSYGPHSLAPDGAPEAASPGTDGANAPYVGHFRTFSPWYPSFRVVERDGVLRLIAATGVEAPADDPELVRVGEHTFRIGADPRLPERLVFGPIVDGIAVEVDRDGCRCSRSFRA